MPLPRERIKQIVREVRQNVATERLERPPESIDESSEVLYGQCVENAQLLAERLAEETDAPIAIVEGGLDLRGEPVPSDYEEARAVGTNHHWVTVVDDSGATVHCNLVREGFSKVTGEILVSDRPPAAYIDFGRRNQIQ